MQPTDARSVPPLMIVGIFAAAFVLLTVLLNILVLFIPFDNPAMGLIIVFAAASAAAQNWVLREGAVPANGRAWRLALACGLVSGVLSAGLAVFSFSGDKFLWRAFSNAGGPMLVLIFAAITAIQVLFIRLAFWLAFRQAARRVEP